MLANFGAIPSNVAQYRHREDGQMPSLDAIGIVSGDVGASMEFYRLLGLEFPEAEDDHVEATAPGGLRVMLDRLDMVKEYDPDWLDPQGRPIGLAFLCESPSEVDATYERVVAAGYRGKKQPFDAYWGQRYATVLDPDGNAVDLFARLSDDGSS
jgi:uncharacterized glyoxalase superfamily protein PhnB